MIRFRGFSDELVRFFEELDAHNTQAWFAENRERYETFVKAPALAYITELGRRLQADISPGINAVSKIDGSLFRIHRDVRFTKDKRPYKTHLGIWFWDGDRKRMENPGFYFMYESGELMHGAGLYEFPPDLLKRYREAAADAKLGKRLKAAAETVFDRGYEIGVRHYKRVPKGYDKDHPMADFLRYSGLVARIRTPLPDVFQSPELEDVSMAHFTNMRPIFDWLKAVL